MLNVSFYLLIKCFKKMVKKPFPISEMASFGFAKIIILIGRYN